MLLCLNPFEIRVSFERSCQAGSHPGRVSIPSKSGVHSNRPSLFNNIGKMVSQSLRNQGFIRTKETAEQCDTTPVSIPSKSGFHSNGSMTLLLPSPSSLNPFEIRVSFERKMTITSSSTIRLNPFEIRVSFELGVREPSEKGRMSQSLRNQGFIRTRNARTMAKCPSLNPFEIRVSFEPLRRSTVSRC